MASLSNFEHRNQDATIYVGNLDPVCDEDILMELFTQVGRVASVHMPKDKLTDQHNGYGFVEFLDLTDAEYAIQIMSMVKLHEKPLRVSRSSLDKKVGQQSLDIGANLFIGNLDPLDVDEKILYDTFGAFGTIIRPPKVMREEHTNQSKGYGFISYNCFEAADMAIECMHNQFLCNRQVVVQYAYKKANPDDMETGRAPGTGMERHGSKIERMLAASNPMHKYMSKHTVNNTHKLGVQHHPNTMFATSMDHPHALANIPIPPPLPPTVPIPAPPPLPLAATMELMPPLPPPPLPPEPLTMEYVTAGGGMTSIPPPPPALPPMGMAMSSNDTDMGSIPPPPPAPPGMGMTMSSTIDTDMSSIPPPPPGIGMTMSSTTDTDMSSVPPPPPPPGMSMPMLSTDTSSIPPPPPAPPGMALSMSSDRHVLADEATDSSTEIPLPPPPLNLVPPSDVAGTQHLHVSPVDMEQQMMQQIQSQIQGEQASPHLPPGY